MTKKIISWVLTGLLAALFVFSAFKKIMPDEAALKMAELSGLDNHTYLWIGIIEFMAVILFIIPRTGIIGFLLLASYMGGAIATNLEHDQNIVFPVLIQVLIWVTAFLRFPQLGASLLRTSES